ncbi:putative amidase [Naematelia encephala]|uniref:amidase n=1 Tax=Naematelia encephala TaxID=71784 RepID=A0A1Y2BAZ5_9TREE|nr:putative amidase [Naematelia encephala]
MVQVTAHSSPWPQVALDAQQAVMDSIPEYARLNVMDWKARYPPGSDVRPVAAECGLMTARELEITDMAIDATDIIAAIKDRKWSAEEVCLAFGKRACIAHQMTSCLAEIFLEEGLARARELDETYKRTGKVVGPLHGLPFDIKEHYRMKGHRSTVSSVDRLSAPPETEHNTLLQTFEDAGAVFYVRSNAPQFVMHLETHSFWGETTNPWNTKLTPGGSSGGCSSLLAFGGAPISLGGDIGGSLRAPAAACGLWTLKPNNQRVPRENQAVSLGLYQEGITGSNGPLARSLRDCHLFFKTVLGVQPWLNEQSLVALPWRESALFKATRPIRLGLMPNDGVVVPQPPMRRAFASLVEALKGDPRFELVEYMPFEHKAGVELAHELYFPDGGKSKRALLASTGEPILGLSEWILAHPAVTDHTLDEYSDLLCRRNSFRARYLKHFNESKVDAILCPPSYGPAQALGTTKYWGYTSIFNILDYPAAVFPTGLVASPKLDPKDPIREYLSDYDKYAAEIYEPETHDNAPLSLQLVGRRWHEEDLMHILGLIAKRLPLKL